MSIPQSLPSFAQAFSNSSLSDIAPISNALPPIQPNRNPTKKRSREDPRTSVDPHNADANRQSPMSIRIKEEDRDDVHRASQSPHGDDLSRDTSAAPAPPPLLKKRRVTVSGAPPADLPSPLPVSPVVTAFPVPDDAVPRAVLSKQQQMAPADQRRASTSATAIPPPPASAPIVSVSRSPPGDSLSASKLTRIGRVSPSTPSVGNRGAGNPVASGSQTTTARPLTPPTIIVSNLQSSALTPAQNAPEPVAAHSLPPPPISFARRRAAQSGGRKKKPADILISPRGAGPSDPLAPVIQSAPPVADPGRFPMAIPRLPLMLSNAQATRRVASNVPPTPTRFSLQGTTAPSISSTARSMQSPPNPSVPIANTLVPPTPHALHHANYAGDKSAFLAPFELFYDALNDSKQLKGWLSDQLQKSNSLLTSLKQQQEKMDEIVEDLVEKRTRVMREEMVMLRQRMESLEEALLAVRAESVKGDVGYAYPQGSKFHQNGIPPGSEPTTSYRFPAPEQRREPAQPSSSPPARRLSVSQTSARAEAPAVLVIGGHNRVASGSQNAAKSTPPMRPQAISERSSSSRQVDSRSARPYFSGSSPAR